MQDKIKLLKEENDSMQSTLNSCRGELTDEQNSRQQIYQDLQSAKRNIKTLEDDKKVLQNQLNSEKAENDSLRDQIRKLENCDCHSCQRSEKKLHQKLLQLQNRCRNCELPKLNRMQRLEKLRNAISDSLTELWHENFVNDEYVIAYEFNSNLDSKIKHMLPKVRL